MVLETATLYIRVLLFLGSMSGNSAFVHMIVWNTPKSIQTYSYILLTYVVCDVVVSVSDSFCMATCINVGEFFIIACRGICHWTAPWSCQTFYTLQSAAYMHSIFVQSFSFLFRYVVVKDQSTAAGTDRHKIFVYAFLSILFIPSSIFLVGGITAPGIRESVTNEVRRNASDIFDQNTTYFGVSNPTLLGRFLKYYCFVPWIPLYISNFVLRYLVISSLEAQKEIFSVNTLKMHRRLIQALTYQALLPTSFLVGMMLDLPQQIGVSSNHRVTHVVYLAWSLVPCVSPFLQIYFIIPYRKALKRLLPKAPDSSLFFSCHNSNQESARDIVYSDLLRVGVTGSDAWDV